MDSSTYFTEEIWKHEDMMRFADIEVSESMRHRTSYWVEVERDGIIIESDQHVSSV